MRLTILVSAAAALLAGPALAQEGDAEKACVDAAVEQAPANVTIGEIRAKCQEDPSYRHAGRPAAQTTDTAAPAVTRRLEAERASMGKAWVITPHRANFILPYAYNNSFDSDFYKDLGYSRADGLKDYEAIFQISMKFPLWYGLKGDTGDVFFAFTSRARWQVYADDVSSPFRETNYSPEVFVSFDHDGSTGPLSFLGFNNVSNSFGLIHQSNGRDEPVSRSWNRIYAAMLWEKGDFAFQIKPWYRFHESKDDDDNPNIERYVGYADYAFGWAPGEHRVTGILRNNLKSWDENKGSLELNYSYPIWGGLRLYVQYFNGYGDGLVYYNEHTNRIGVGIALNDLL
jgi:phospholipase A1